MKHLLKKSEPSAKYLLAISQIYISYLPNSANATCQVFLLPPAKSSPCQLPNHSHTTCQILLVPPAESNSTIDLCISIGRIRLEIGKQKFFIFWSDWIELKGKNVSGLKGWKVLHNVPDNSIACMQIIIQKENTCGLNYFGKWNEYQIIIDIVLMFYLQLWWDWLSKWLHIYVILYCRCLDEGDSY